MAYIRVLKYKVYVLIKKEDRVILKKLNKRVKVNILVRYEGNYIYRVYIPFLKGGYGKVVRTFYARFDEGGLIIDPLNHREDDIFDLKNENNPIITTPIKESTNVLNQGVDSAAKNKH